MASIHGRRIRRRGGNLIRDHNVGRSGVKILGVAGDQAAMLDHRGGEDERIGQFEFAGITHAAIAPQ